MVLDIDFTFLFNAIKENRNISVYFKIGEKNKLTYRSRFFEVNQGEKFIIIDFPTSARKKAKTLVPDDSISILFKFSGFRFLFHSKILEKINYQLNPEVTTQAFKIQFPSEILDGNRRNYFRVTVPVNEPIEINYILVNRSRKDSLTIKKDGDKSQFFEAIMIDISEGGIALKGKKPGNLSKGDRLLIWFNLDSWDKEYVEIEGTVRSIRQFAEEEIHLWAIEFIPKKDINYKRTLQRINKYVMNNQRRNLSRYK